MIIIKKLIGGNRPDHIIAMMPFQYHSPSRLDDGFLLLCAEPRPNLLLERAIVEID